MTICSDCRCELPYGEFLTLGELDSTDEEHSVWFTFCSWLCLSNFARDHLATRQPKHGDC